MRNLEKLAEILDTKFKFGKLRFGLDSIIGLIPVVGDVTTSLLSTYIIFQALIMKVPLSIILKMVFNVGLETLIGAIPILGNIFDLFWKSNIKNIALMKNYQENPELTVTKSKISIITGFILVSSLFIAIVILSIWVFTMLIGFLSSSF